MGLLTITEQFPPLPLNELIAEIEAFSTYDDAGKNAFVKKLVSVHPVFNIDMNVLFNLAERRFRRARNLEVTEGLPQTVEEVIWRKGVPARLGRMNEAGFAVMYLADHTDTAFSEILDGSNDKRGRIVVADFAVQPNAPFRAAQIGCLHLINRTGRGFVGESQNKINDMLNACDRKDLHSLLITDAFLFECLTKQTDDNDSDHQISSCVAMNVYSKLPEISAIAYPSVRQRFAINFAVRTENFWKEWGLESVRCGQTEHLAQGYFRFIPDNHVVGVTVAGDFQWEEDEPVEGMRHQLKPLWTPV